MRAIEQIQAAKKGRRRGGEDDESCSSARGVDLGSGGYSRGFARSGPGGSPKRPHDGRRHRSEIRILHDLSWSVRPGFSRVLRDAAPRRAAAAIYRKSVAGLHRASAAEPRNGQCRPRHYARRVPRFGRAHERLESSPVGGAPTGDVALGKEIFANGLPDQNVPACSACHGPDAKGQREIPRLAGQLYWYMVGTLSLWSSERGQGGRQDISWIMRPTVANLTPKQVQALAEYVSALR